MFIRDIGLSFSFFAVSLFGFGIGAMLASQDKLRSVFFNFLEKFEKDL